MSYDKEMESFALDILSEDKPTSLYRGLNEAVLSSVGKDIVELNQEASEGDPLLTPLGASKEFTVIYSTKYEIVFVGNNKIHYLSKTDREEFTLYFNSKSAAALKKYL